MYLFFSQKVDASPTTFDGILKDELWTTTGSRKMLPEIIYRIQPTTKLILILRNPSTRQDYILVQKYSFRMAHPNSLSAQGPYIVEPKHELPIFLNN